MPCCIACVVHRESLGCLWLALRSGVVAGGTASQRQQSRKLAGGLIGVELGILYDSRELERLSGGETVNEVPSKSEPRPSSNCKSRRVLACRFSVWFLSTKTRGRSCPRGTIACHRAKQINHAINSKSK